MRKYDNILGWNYAFLHFSQSIYVVFLLDYVLILIMIYQCLLTQIQTCVLRGIDLFLLLYWCLVLYCLCGANLLCMN